MDVTLLGTGPNSNIEAQVDPTFQAVRTSLRPIEFSGAVLGGHYSVDAITGSIAAGTAANSQIFQIRWADPAKLFVLKRLQAQGVTVTAFAANTLGASLELIIGHGSTASGSGGNAVAPTSISNRMRATMAPTAFVTSGSIRAASTGALTAATGETLEPAGLTSGWAANQVLGAISPTINLWDQWDAGGHPLVLLAGDTLVVRAPNIAATGVWGVAFTMQWVEATVY